MTLRTLSAGDRKRQSTLEAIPPLERSRTDGQLRVTHGFRGVTLEQAIRYPESLGGKRAEGRTVEGSGWEAHLSTRVVPVGPSYRLTEVRITWLGDPETVEAVVLRFRITAFRAPG